MTAIASFMINYCYHRNSLIMFVGTTAAATLLGISTQRVRVLLKEGPIQGAQKIARVWDDLREVVRPYGTSPVPWPDRGSVSGDKI